MGSMNWRGWICIAILSICVLLAVTGCSSPEDAIYERVMAQVGGNNDADPTYAFTTLTLTPPYYPELAQSTPVPGDTLSGELLIKGFRENRDPPEVYWLAREFMELHPNVTITLNFNNSTYEILTPEAWARRKSDYYTQTRADLASGQADYLLFSAANDLDLYSLSQSGVLQDMRERWETDPDIADHDRFFSEVIDGFMVDGKLTVMPYSFTIPGVYLNREMLEELGIREEEISTVSTAELLDWYERAREKHPDLQLLYNGQDRSLLFDLEKLHYINLDSGAVRFQDPDFLRFLERSASAILKPPVLASPWETNLASGLYMEATSMYQETGDIPVSIELMEKHGYPDYAEMVRTDQVSFAVVGELGVYESLGLMQPPLAHLAGPFPLTAPGGQLGLSTYYTDFIMPSSLKNSDIAWEFMKYCMSDRKNLKFEGYGFTGCFYYDGSALSINKKNLAAKVEHVLVHGTDGGNILGFEQNHFGHTTGEEIVARLEEILSHSPTSLGLYNVDVQDFLNEYYINKLTTPEQCARKIQDRVMIWLNE